MPICAQLTPLLLFGSPTHYFSWKIWPKTLAKIEHRTVLFHGFYGPHNCLAVLRKIKFSYFYRGLLNGCDGNHVRFCHHDGHRAQLLLSRTYPHACARLGPNVSYNKNTPLYFNLVKFQFLDTFWARKLPEFLVPSFKSSKTKVTVVFLIIKASATTSLVQVVRVDGPQPAFNLGATPTWRKRGLPSRIGGPHGNFSGLLSLFLHLL